MAVMRRILALAVMLLAPRAAAAQGAVVGSAAANFTLGLLRGGQIRLADLRGRPVVINFWATWCAPCRTEMPRLVAADSAHRADGLTVVAVNLTDQERRRDVVRFVSEFQMNFPVALDERGRVRELYKLQGVPTSVFVDSAGVVRLVQRGPLSEDSLARGLAAILPRPSNAGASGGKLP